MVIAFLYFTIMLSEGLVGYECLNFKYFTLLLWLYSSITKVVEWLLLISVEDVETVITAEYRTRLLQSQAIYQQAGSVGLLASLFSAAGKTTFNTYFEH